MYTLTYITLEINYKWARAYYTGFYMLPLCVMCIRYNMYIEYNQDNT